MDMQERIDIYWSKRADEFSQCRLEDFAGPQREIWLQILKESLPATRGLRALDIGTGAGFYAFLLSDLGCSVTAIDYSRAMIANAVANAKVLHYDGIELLKMDAQNLVFEDGYFDFIISRNVTWTLSDPQKAYQEWCRVLAPGGIILNFDANYGAKFKLADENGETLKEQQQWSKSNYSAKGQSAEMIRERNDIAKQLYICNYARPQWDVDVLIQNGVTLITIDTAISKRIYPKMDSHPSQNSSKKDDGNAYPVSQMFMVKAVKE